MVKYEYQKKTIYLKREENKKCVNVIKLTVIVLLTMEAGERKTLDSVFTDFSMKHSKKVMKILGQQQKDIREKL